MMTSKTDKERAFLHDLFVAPDWGERFATLIDENLTLPNQGSAVYLGSGTGNHALAIADRGGPGLQLIGVEESQEAVHLSNEKAAAAKAGVEFRRDDLDRLSLSDGQFDLVVSDGSLAGLQRLPKILSEILRVAKPGAHIVFVLPTAPSFGEFFSLYWEALHNLGLIDREGEVEKLIQQVPTTWQMEDLSTESGLQDVESLSRNEEFSYESGEAFLESPLVAEFLLTEWLSAVPGEWRGRVVSELVRLINEERHDADFVLTVKATLIKGRKARSH